jgi:hypothetical protein
MQATPIDIVTTPPGACGLAIVVMEFDLGLVAEHAADRFDDDRLVVDQQDPDLELGDGLVFGGAAGNDWRHESLSI